jgi:aerobic-type carbon monoxide dehydrogenase small subunit (CoxS/CutS family)
MPVTLEVNGETHVLEVPPTRRLLTTLREDLALTGPKLGCGEGACGACAVLLDGKPVVSCLLPVAAGQGPRG